MMALDEATLGNGGGRGPRGEDAPLIPASLIQSTGLDSINTIDSIYI